MAAIAVRASHYNAAQQPVTDENILDLFDSNDIATRAEGAAIIKRLYDYINIIS